MHHTFHKVSSQDLNQNLKPVIETFLGDLVRQREPGHCMRVGNLDSELMVGIATGLAATFRQSAQIHVLTSRERTADSRDGRFKPATRQARQQQRHNCRRSVSLDRYHLIGSALHQHRDV